MGFYEKVKHYNIFDEVDGFNRAVCIPTREGAERIQKIFLEELGRNGLKIVPYKTLHWDELD